MCSKVQGLHSSCMYVHVLACEVKHVVTRQVSSVSVGAVLIMAIPLYACLFCLAHLFLYVCAEYICVLFNNGTPECVHTI